MDYLAFLLEYYRGKDVLFRLAYLNYSPLSSLLIRHLNYSFRLFSNVCNGGSTRQFPRRESHSLEPKGTGFTDPPAYFNGLLRNKMEDPRVELGLKDFQSSARTGYTNLPNSFSSYSIATILFKSICDQLYPL